MAHGEPVLYSLYVYAPTFGPAVFFTVAYAISAAFHIWQCRRYHAFGLVGLHPLCAVLFTAGYALRSYGASDDNYLYRSDDKGPLITFILSQIFIFICPPLLELANYHILGRIFYYVPYLAPLPPGRVLTVFGGLMAVVEALNGLGVSLAANPTSSKSLTSTGKNLIMAAVSLQLGLTVTFCGLAAVFQRRCVKANVYGTSRAVRVQLWVLYASMTLIFARCIYRLVEHTGHTDIDLDNLEALRGLSPILRYEAYFYVFEASLMLLNSLLWNVLHPGRFLPRSHHVYIGRDGREVEGEKIVDERPLWKKVIHVVTFALLFGRESQPTDFQELVEVHDGRRTRETGNRPESSQPLTDSDQVRR